MQIKFLFDFSEEVQGERPQESTVQKYIRQGNEYLKKLCFNCFKAGTFIEEPFSETAYQEAIDWAQKSIEEIKDADDFNPYVEYFGCRYICGVSDECCYWQMR